MQQHSSSVHCLLSLFLLFIIDSANSQCQQCLPNPCKAGAPLATQSGQWFTCDWRRRDACPTGFWCHVGSSVLSTTCCSVIGCQFMCPPNNPCDAPVDVGQSGPQASTVSRWYFDQQTRTCKPFLYRGLRGNSNNFVTREHCQSICPEVVNPCCCGEPARDAQSGRRLQCGSSGDQSGCPSGFWCHIGSSADTTACCPGSGSACAASYSVGLGGERLSRWWYNPQTLRCLSFQYSGIRGSQNNFLTQQQCENTCDVFENPCPTAYTAAAPIYCRPDSRTCPIGMWCHLGASAKATVCCPALPDSVCRQPLVEGQGSAALSRWYLDRSEGLCGQCRQFTYKGIRGNQNSFLTQQECAASCPSCVNPCASGVPLLDTNERPMSCSVYGQCPVGYWCHLGADVTTTVCCPNAQANACALPLVAGDGNAQLTRWAFDPRLGLCGQCRQFQYNGLKGNQNNYPTAAQCQAACPSCVNPCPNGDTPQLGSDSRPVKCGPIGGCAAGQWCHVGANEASTVCCPDLGVSVCEQPQAQGSGQAALSRWFVDRAVGLCGSCRQFVYRGLAGNQNNFLTQQDCENACPSCVNPCASGTPLLNTERRPVQCSPQSPCPNSHWCHIGQRPATTVCCPATGELCSTPMSVGTGSANLPRWYYDAASRSCRPFTYNGLRGSQNMFLTLGDCEAVGCPLWQNACGQGSPLLDGLYPQVCNANQVCPSGYYCHIGPIGANLTQCCPTGPLDVCEQPQSVGQGQYALPRFYYDSRSRSCNPITYRGTKGNANNFLSQSDCAAVCPVYENVCASGTPQLSAQSSRPVGCSSNQGCQAGYWCHIGASADTTMCCPGGCRYCPPAQPNLLLSTAARDACNERVAEGDSGNGAPVLLSRWYYDQQYQICRRFNYRGQRGNQNNFQTRAQCQQQCREVNICGTGQPLLDQANSPVPCIPSDPNSCPISHYCHVGSFALDDFSATICCPVIGDPCEQPRREGSVLGNPISRWYYDRADDECRRFQYGGMQGNQNNFGSSLECETVCPGFRRFCPHNKPLLSLGVPQTCSIENACPAGYVCNVALLPDQAQSAQPSSLQQQGTCCPDPANFCFEPRAAGSCGEFETRYGYDPATNTCISYQYSGCGGTLNNFRSLQRCTEICCDEFRLR